MRSRQHINCHAQVAAGLALSFVVAIDQAAPNSQDTQTMTERTLRSKLFRSVSKP